jgi:hypothetical protein
METAVEWFAEKLQSDKIFNFETVLSKAKQMEKQRIIDFGYDIADKLACGVYPDKKAIGELYNEFFKSDETI